MMDGMMMLSTDFFRRAMRDAAILEARAKCIEGWASLSEEDLAKVIYDFSLRVNDELIKENGRLYKAVFDQTAHQLPSPIIIPKQ